MSDLVQVLNNDHNESGGHDIEDDDDTIINGGNHSINKSNN